MNYNNNNGSRRNKRSRYSNNNNKNKNGQNNQSEKDGNAKQQPDERRVNGAMPYVVVCIGCGRKQRVILTKRTIKKCNNHISDCNYYFMIKNGVVTFREGK